MSDSKISLPAYIELLKGCLDLETHPTDSRLRALMFIAAATDNPDLANYTAEFKVDIMTPITPIERSIVSAIGIELPGE